ncbi:MAG TPA: MoaD/ThiS family protein [Candidatus Methylomirabilis sp.]
MVVKVRIFGAQKLVDQMGTNVVEVEFAGGTIKDLFGTLLERHGFTWADFPLLKDWHENLSIMIYRNEEILLKDAYRTQQLADGDFLSFHIHTGCC